ncbi:hypothetical protein FI667_g16288, partial [Globisporangium splendens]
MADENLQNAGDEAAPSPSQQQEQPFPQAPPGLSLPVAAAVPEVESEETVATARAIEGSAFSTWKESLSLELEAGCNTLKTQVHALQSDFDDASVFIRGDLAWRKQVGCFHDEVNDILHAQIEVMRSKLKQNADLLSLSVAESLSRKDLQTKLELSRQAKMYEDKLRRTRTSLKKEIDRFTHLEKCLRKEEAFQTKEMYDALVLQLTTEHEAKEAALHALLNELRSSYSAMELGNTYLMESLKAARKEAELMKKMLIKQTNNASGSPRKSFVRSPTRFSGATVGGTPGIQDVYVQSLKQALSTSAQTIEGLKKQVAELTGDKENCLRKVRLAEDATSKVNNELAKVTQLLSESHAALIANKKAMEQVESEKAHWKDLFVELQFRTGSNAQEVEAAKKLADATRDQIAALEKQVKRLEDVERQKQAIVRARPMSASPCLILTEHADREEPGQQQSPFAAKQRSFSTAGPVSHARMKYRLGNARQPQSSPMTMPPSSHRHIAKPFLYAQPENNPDSIPRLSEPQQQVEHIRSILKTELVQVSPTENQLEDGSHLGPDGVHFIYLVPCLWHCDAGLLMANLEIVVAFVVVDPANPSTPSQSQMRNLRTLTLSANKIAKEIA